MTASDPIGELDDRFGSPGAVPTTWAEAWSRLEQADHTCSRRAWQDQVAGWTAGLSAFFIVGALTVNATWPMAIGVVAVAAMVATACFFMLRRP